MLAVDTNILVRYLTGDDSKQEERAADLIRRRSIWVSKTVLLETYWVLGSMYRFTPSARGEAIRKLSRLRNVTFEDEPAVFRALAWFESGLEFADAMHLASVDGATAFATFDQPLARRARRLTDLDIISA